MEQYEDGYDPIWYADLRRLGLTGENFINGLFAPVREAIMYRPYVAGSPVRGGDGTLMLSTRSAFPDLPPVHIYFKPDIKTRRVKFIGLDRDEESSDWLDGMWF